MICKQNQFSAMPRIRGGGGGRGRGGVAEDDDAGGGCWQ